MTFSAVRGMDETSVEKIDVTDQRFRVWANSKAVHGLKSIWRKVSIGMEKLTSTCLGPIQAHNPKRNAVRNFMSRRSSKMVVGRQSQLSSPPINSPRINEDIGGQMPRKEPVYGTKKSRVLITVNSSTLDLILNWQ